MKIILYQKDGNKYDITHAVDGVQWSGDYQQVARKLLIDMLYASNDKNQKVLLPDYGDVLVLYEDDKELFRGYVWFIDFDSNSQFAKYTAVDALIYLTKSELSKNFKNLTPEEITTKLCDEYDVPIGKIAKTGIRRNYIAQANTPYDIIMAAYTHSSRINGKKYMPRIENGKLNIITKGNELVPVELSEDYNLFGSKYNSSLDALVNKVSIYDENGNFVSSVSNQKSINKYGLITKTMDAEKGKDNTAIAKGMLKGIDKKAEVSAFGNIRAITGNAVKIKDSVTKLVGIFYIDADTHSWKNGVYSMSLTVTFVIVMDEKEMEEMEQKADTSGSGSGEEMSDLVKKQLEMNEQKESTPTGGGGGTQYLAVK